MPSLSISKTPSLSTSNTPSLSISAMPSLSFSRTQTPTITPTITPTNMPLQGSIIYQICTTTTYNNATLCCGAAPSTDSNIYLAPGQNPPVVSDLVYTNQTLTTLMVGNGKYYYVVKSGVNYACQIDDTGTMTAVTACVSLPSPTPTTTPTTTPTKTPSLPVTYTVTFYASTNASITGGVNVGYGTDGVTYTNQNTTVSSNPSSPSQVYQFTVANNTLVYFELRSTVPVNVKFAAGTTIDPTSYSYCGESLPYSLTVTGNVSVYLNAQVTSGALVSC